MKTAQMNVDYVDHMGSDLTVVNAARVSFDKESDWEKHPITKPWDEDSQLILARLNMREAIKEGRQTYEEVLSERDTKLIGYLAKHNHWSPFAHTSIQLRIKAPIFVARQLVKHQVGLVWNEVSRRYVDSEPEFYFPEQWRGRPKGSMKQGSSGVVTELVYGGKLDVFTHNHIKENLRVYMQMLKSGVAPEQARMILPQNTMTEWIWTGSLMAFVRVCRERMASGAQQETREVAEQIAEIVAPLFPVSWSALMEN